MFTTSFPPSRLKMRASAFLLAALMGLMVVDAAPCCSGAVCRPIGTQIYDYFGTSYCCPSSSDTPTYNVDSQSCTCASSTVCPALAAVAMWESHGCNGPATFAAVAAKVSSSGTDTCTDLSIATPFTLNCNARTIAGVNQWQLAEYSTCPSDFFMNDVGVVGDMACYNLGTGSVVIDCTSTAASRVGHSTGSVAVHSSTQNVHQTAPGAFSTNGYNNAVGYWFDSTCVGGSGQMVSSSSTSTTCHSKANSPVTYAVTCASNDASSAWTIVVWAASSDTITNIQSCQANAVPTATITGSGGACKATAYGGFLVDCTIASQFDYVNYIPTMPGNWTVWSTCSGSCMQTRECSNPAPSGGGAPCAGASSQTCNTPVCSGSGGDGTAGGITNPSSTGGTSGQSGYDATAWLGTYSLTAGCDQSQCCCARTSTITANGDGTTYTITGTDVAGQCGTGSLPNSIVSTMPIPTSNMANYMFGGNAHTATRNSASGALDDRSSGNTACSATLTKVTNNNVNSSGGRSASSLQLASVLMMLLVTVVGTVLYF